MNLTTFCIKVGGTSERPGGLYGRNQDQQKQRYNSGSVHKTPEKLVLPGMRFRLIRIKKLPVFMINRNIVKTQETKSWGAGNTKNIHGGFS